MRPARAGDLPAIVDMRDRLNQHELTGCPHAAIVRLSLEQFTALWGPTLDSPTHCWRVVEVQGRLVGYGLIFLSTPLTSPPGAYVQWTYLEDAYRREGLGKRLVDELFDWARSQGANRIELQFIDGNDIAERFWTKVGFRHYARRCVRWLSP